MPNQFHKLFTLREANQLIPELEVLIRQLQEETADLRRRVARLVDSNPGLKEMTLAQLVEYRPELGVVARRMAVAATRIESMGCLLKDIDQGLIDFPCRLEEDDEVVFLCWQFGESALLAWHPIDGGFASRRPLAGAPKRYLN